MPPDVGLVEKLGDFEVHAMPNGDRCYYRDSDHSYFTEVAPKTKGRGEAKEIVGYTGVKTARLGSPSAISGHAESGVPDPLADWIANEGPNWRQKRDRKGEVGTLIHAAFEDRLRGNISTDDAPEDAAGYLSALDRLFADHIIESVLTETVVYSCSHAFAGRFDAQVCWGGQRADALCRLDEQPGAKLLWDVKTSGFIGRKYHQQLHLYDLAAEECGYGASDGLYIVQLRDDGTYVLWPCRSSRSAALHSLALYKDGKLTDAACRADHKALTA